MRKAPHSIYQKYLVRVGANFKCPYHLDDEGSISISESDDFICRSCGLTGSVKDFLLLMCPELNSETSFEIINNYKNQVEVSNELIS